MTPTGTLLGDRYEVPEEERVAPRQRETYDDLVRRLAHQSVAKHFDAYADIAWDDPDYRIDPDDPRWELGPDDALGATAWYRAQPPAVRSRIGLRLYATFMKIGVQFESVLKRGLLEFADRLPAGSPEFRYAYHEIIEEAQHSLMFQEFVARTGFDIPGLSWWQRIGARQVIRFGRTFPELFFVFVLGGEDPIDHVQRTALRSGRPLHPLLKRIMQIHVTEEARHLCFARHYLRRHAATLGPVKRFVLASRAPIILAIMAQLMMRPSPDLVRAHGIPAAVIDEAYTRNPVHRAYTLVALRKVRDLLAELGLVTPVSQRLWSWLGIWEPAPVLA
jgi:para-aminobenzoate N-oxygenase AurF